MKRSIPAPNNSRPMTPRAAQALAAIVFLAGRNKSQTPNIAALGSLLIVRPWHRTKVKNPDGKGWHWGWELDINPLRQQRKVARHWLDFFSNQGVTYFFDEVGPTSYHEFINCKELVVDQDEAITILALHRASQTDGGGASLLDLTMTLGRDPRTTLQPGQLPFLLACLDALRDKGYIRLLESHHLLTKKAKYQLPYLRILARNFQTARRRVISK